MHLVQFFVSGSYFFICRFLGHCHLYLQFFFLIWMLNNYLIWNKQLGILHAFNTVNSHACYTLHDKYQNSFYVITGLPRNHFPRTIYDYKACEKNSLQNIYSSFNVKWISIKMLSSLCVKQPRESSRLGLLVLLNWDAHISLLGYWCQLSLLAFLLGRSKYSWIHCYNNYPIKHDWMETCCIIIFYSTLNAQWDFS